VTTRVVVTSPTGYVHDGPAPTAVDAPNGYAVAEVLWMDSWGAASIRSADDWPLEPPPSGLSSRIITMPAGTSFDMHATDTLDLMVVLDGEIALGLPSGEHVVRAGECVVQRGTEHAWRVPDSGPCTYWVTMLRPHALTGDAPETPVRVGGSSGVTRYVTRPDGGVDVDEAPVGLEIGATRMVDLWHTGGPVVDVTQGGDPQGDFELEPPPGGAWLRYVELGDPNSAVWHTTRSVDVDVVVRGRVAHDLREGGTVELGPGDVLVQHGTDHRWRALTDDFRMASLMLES
jgi:quercetin dioxygenase-like cupin family protein